MTEEEIQARIDEIDELIDSGVPPAEEARLYQERVSLENKLAHARGEDIFVDKNYDGFEVKGQSTIRDAIWANMTPSDNAVKAKNISKGRALPPSAYDLYKPGKPSI